MTAKVSATASTATAIAYRASNRYVPRTVTVDAGTGKLNLVTAYTYDSFGNLAQVDGPRTDVADATSYTYDAERRLTQYVGAIHPRKSHREDLA